MESFMNRESSEKGFQFSPKPAYTCRGEMTYMKIDVKSLASRIAVVSPTFPHVIMSVHQRHI